MIIIVAVEEAYLRSGCPATILSFPHRRESKNDDSEYCSCMGIFA
jgi:hypothetical protein